MLFMKIITVAFLAIAAQGCELNEMEIQKDGMDCVAAHTDPEFMMAVYKHMMNNPDEMAKPTFICNYQKELVKIVMCMKDKVERCLPKEFKTLIDLMIVEKNMAEGMKFMCDHKDILQDKCMDDNVQDFAQCYMSRLSVLQNKVASTTDLKSLSSLICSVVRTEEQCFRENKGSCSKKFIEIVVETLEKFFPMSSCPKTNNAVSSKEALTNTVLGSILINGVPQSRLKPLKFKPGMYPSYAIKT